MNPADDDGMSTASSTLPGGVSFSTRSIGSSDFRSFSAAGSSSVVSSTIGPLMANLMSGLQKKKREHEEPSYLRRDAESLENNHHHNDFKSNLL